MATKYYVKRTSKWCVQLRNKGFRKGSFIFTTEEEADTFKESMERKISLQKIERRATAILDSEAKNGTCS